MSRVRDTVLIENNAAAFAAGLPHRVLATEAESSDRPAGPAVVMIHGRHGDERVPWIFARTMPESWFLVSPRGIEFEPETPEHETGYSWITMPDAGWPDIDRFDESVEQLHEFVLALPEIYPVDPNQIYLLGFSQGAAAAAALAMQHPGLVKGIAFLVGFVPETDADLLDARPLEQLPIFMAVGTKDERIPLDVAHLSFERLKLAGAQVDYGEYQTGHKLNGDGMRRLKQWWAQFLT